MQQVKKWAGNTIALGSGALCGSGLAFGVDYFGWGLLLLFAVLWTLAGEGGE